MADSAQTQIGILACPGGMAFAQKILGHLETITRDKLEERVSILREVLQPSPGPEIIRQMNLAADIQPASGGLDEPIDEQRTNTYLVPAEFTRFPNGEFKTEILHSPCAARRSTWCRTSPTATRSSSRKTMSPMCSPSTITSSASS